jgi:hypothetical protein
MITAMHGYRRTARAFDAQVKQLRAAGCEKVFRETASGARFDLAQLRRVLLLRRCRTVLPSTTQGPTQGDRRVEHYLDHRDRLHRRHHRAFPLARSEQLEWLHTDDWARDRRRVRRNLHRPDHRLVPGLIGATVGALLVLFIWNRLVAHRVLPGNPPDPGAPPRRRF